MPFQVFALLMLLPALAACTSTSQSRSQPDISETHQQPLLQALYHWSPALDPAHAESTNGSLTNSTTTFVTSPAQAQVLALQQSPRIRSILASQGIADADYQQATLISNPGFSASALRAEGSGSWKTEFGISFGILDWLTQPLRKTLAGAELEAARSRALNALTREIGHIRNSYFAAVAARQASRQQQQTVDAAQLNADLARQLHLAGNLSELARLQYDNELARQQLSAHQTLVDANTRLAELKLALGLAFDSELIIPDALPDTDADLLHPAGLQTLMRDKDAFASWLTTVTAQRPDAMLLRSTRTALQQQLSLQQKQFGISNIGLGLIAEREPDGSNASGFELDLSLPLFDRGQNLVASTRARLDQWTADEQALQLAIAHQLNVSLSTLFSLAQQLRQLRDEDIPRQQQMLELTLQEYNFMLSGPFELIRVKQQESETLSRYIRLLERYWAEYADLMQHSANTADAFISGLSPASIPPASPSASPAPEAPESESANHQEHHHD